MTLFLLLDAWVPDTGDVWIAPLTANMIPDLVDDFALPVHMRFRGWGQTPSRLAMPDWPRLPVALVEGLAAAWSDILLARLHQRMAR